MSNIYSVSNYILKKLGKISTIKLQKLCYYCQAWSLVWNEKPLFNEQFEAWANGPVCKELYKITKGKFEIDTSIFNNNKKVKEISKIERKTIDAVLKKYGKKDGYYLMQLTHTERPWLEARTNIEPGAAGSKIISMDVMQDYYCGLCE